MVKITKSEREALERVGLLCHKRTGHNACDPSFYVTNKDHVGRNKHTYVVESPNVMRFLGRYEGLNLQRISKKQYESLLNAKLISEKTIQRWEEYNPKAVCFENAFGEYHIIKIASLMTYLGFWKNDKKKKTVKPQNKNENNKGKSSGVNYAMSSNASNDGQNSLNSSGIMPDINEQAKALGMPQVIFRDADTGEIVQYGDLDLLSKTFGAGFLKDNNLE